MPPIRTFAYEAWNQYVRLALLRTPPSDERLISISNSTKANSKWEDVEKEAAYVSIGISRGILLIIDALPSKTSLVVSSPLDIRISVCTKVANETY